MICTQLRIKSRIGPRMVNVQAGEPTRELVNGSGQAVVHL